MTVAPPQQRDEPYICTECGNKMKHIYTHQFSEIYLSKCKKCKNVADKYVEYEMVIIALDLLLHRPQAHRHLIFNRFRNFKESMSVLVRLTLFGVLLYTYVKFGIFQGNKYNFVKHADVFFGVLVGSALETVSYMVGVIIAGYMCLLLFSDGAHVTKLKHIVLSTLLCNFVLVGYVPMIIWKENYSATYVLTIMVFHISTSLIELYSLQLSGNCDKTVINILLAVMVLIVGYAFRIAFQIGFLDVNNDMS